MKKTLAVVVVMLLALTLCVSLCACNSAVGTYKFVSLSMKAGPLSLDIEADKEVDMTAWGGEAKFTMKAEDITLELKADGTWEMKGELMGQSLAQNGTWEEKDGKVALTNDGETIEAKLEDGKLAFEVSEQGMTIKFVLAK